MARLGAGPGVIGRSIAAPQRRFPHTCAISLEMALATKLGTEAGWADPEAGDGEHRLPQLL